MSSCVGYARLADNLLSVDDVCLSFGSNKVLSNVNLKIDDLVRNTGETTGQIVSILGPKGVGKSQLLRILAGLQNPTSGTIRVGKNHLPVHCGMVGMVAQNYPLFRHRTVFGNLKVGAKKGTSGSDIIAMLANFGLSDKKDMYPSQLSGGQRQSVAIAQQLLNSEHYLLLDEPTTGLDILSKNTVIRMIQNVANLDEENTIIMVTHDIRAAITVSDTIYLMGRERDSFGNIIPGAKVVEMYDLIERGLMWSENVTNMSEFINTEREISKRFETL